MRTPRAQSQVPARQEKVRGRREGVRGAARGLRCARALARRARLVGLRARLPRRGEGRQGDGLPQLGAHVSRGEGRALRYLGYIKRARARRARCTAPSEWEQLITIQFMWEAEVKPVSSSFIGTSPEFEMALYSLCFLAGGEENVVRLLIIRRPHNTTTSSRATAAAVLVVQFVHVAASPARAAHARPGGVQDSPPRARALTARRRRGCSLAARSKR